MRRAYNSTTTKAPNGADITDDALALFHAADCIWLPRATIA